MRRHGLHQGLGTQMTPLNPKQYDNSWGFLEELLVRIGHPISKYNLQVALTKYAGFRIGGFGV